MNVMELDFEKRHRIVREVLETLVLTVMIYLSIHLAFQNFTVEGTSMEPNLHDQEEVMADKWSYHLHSIVRGDVIMFIAPPDPAENFVKRVIGLPGDVVTIQGTVVMVNGKVVTNAFVAPHLEGNPFPSFTDRVVPPHSYFVLGDNRSISFDSRAWGCVPEENIIGRAVLVYWPFGQDNNGLVPDLSADFANIPPPSVTHSNDICPVMHNKQA